MLCDEKKLSPHDCVTSVSAVGRRSLIASLVVVVIITSPARMGGRRGIKVPSVTAIPVRYVVTMAPPIRCTSHPQPYINLPYIQYILGPLCRDDPETNRVTKQTRSFFLSSNALRYVLFTCAQQLTLAHGADKQKKQ